MKKFILIAWLIIAMVFFAIPVFADEECEKEIPYPTISEGSNFFVQDSIGYFLISGSIGNVEFEEFLWACKAFERLEAGKIVIVLNSPGGGVFDAIGLVQLMERQKSKGIVVETHCYGIAASAAAIVMSAGTKGYRYIAEGSFIMIHELMTFKFFAVESVSDTEKEAQVKRTIQNEIVAILARNTKLTTKELITKCEEESWANAKTAIKWGFADKLIQ